MPKGIGTIKQMKIKNLLQFLRNKHKKTLHRHALVSCPSKNFEKAQCYFLQTILYDGQNSGGRPSIESKMPIGLKIATSSGGKDMALRLIEKESHLNFCDNH